VAGIGLLLLLLRKNFAKTDRERQGLYLIMGGLLLFISLMTLDVVRGDTDTHNTSAGNVYAVIDRLIRADVTGPSMGARVVRFQTVRFAPGKAVTFVVQRLYHFGLTAT
jgi:hypothetical protein